MTAPEHQKKSPPSYLWFIVAAIAAIVALATGVQQWEYNKKQEAAEQFFRFKDADTFLSQPPFQGISTQIEADKYVPESSKNKTKTKDFVNIVEPKNQAAMQLFETITFRLTPSATSAECRPSGGIESTNIDTYEVMLDAPGFTVDEIGDAVRSPTSPY